MRVAFIGAGKMASQLMTSVDEVDDAKITAVCDVNEEAAREAADPRDAAVFLDHETMFEEHEFDAVFVAIPPFAYSNQATLAVEHGVDLFIEKPVALRPEDAREVEAVLAESDIVTSSGYVFRYDLITERAQELIGSREITLLTGRYWSSLPGSPWGYELETSGGEILIRTTHIHDVARYLAGDATSVTAAGVDRIDVPEVDYDAGTAATIEHENGAVSQISSSITAPGWTVELDIVGDGVELHLDFASQTLTGAVDDESVEFDGDCDRTYREVETFLRAAEAGDQGMVRSPYSDAARTLELSWGVIDAVETDEPISLD